MIGERAFKVVLPKAVGGLWLFGWWVVLLLGSTWPVWGLGLGDRAGQGALSAAGRSALVGAGLGMGNEAFNMAAEELMNFVGGLPSDLTACEVLERLKNAGLIGGGLGGLGGGAAKALSEMDWRKLLSRFRNSDEAIEALNAANSGSRAPFNLWPSKTKGIMGEISDDGIVSFAVEAGAGSPVRGTEMFAQMMKHFGSNVRGVRGSWHYGDNLAAVNKLTSEGMSLSEAALQTWTARRAAEHGFRSVRVLGSEGAAGAYKSVNVVFE